MNVDDIRRIVAVGRFHPLVDVLHDTQRIQETHAMVLHLLCPLFEEAASR